MFDKLIESNSAAADFRNRRKYFVLSAFVVGSLFLIGVVVSIYASDFDLGADQFELSVMLAPVAPPPNQPEPPRPRQQSQPDQETSDLPSRHSNMLRPEESPVEIPPISTTKNTELSRPEGRFIISDRPETTGQSGYSGPGPTGYETGSAVPDTSTAGENEKPVIPAPPPVKEPPISKPAAPQSLGVVNGRATYLPKPPFPAAAVAVNALGKVSVQVMIDEEGKVISAKAVDGHPLLRPGAEAAARQARFTPTLLSKVPVKVTGVIVYNFTRN